MDSAFHEVKILANSKEGAEAKYKAGGLVSDICGEDTEAHLESIEEIKC